MYRFLAIMDTKDGIRNLQKAHTCLPLSIREGMEFTIFDTKDIDESKETYEECKRCARAADFIIFNFHGSMAYFRRYVNLAYLFEGKKPFFFRSSIESEMEEMWRKSELSRETNILILSYFQAGGIKNYENLIRFLCNKIAGIDCTYDPASFPIRNGIYKLPEGMTEEAYKASIVASKKPVIGILIHFHSIQNKQLEHIDALIESIRNHDCIPYAIYTNVSPSEDGNQGGLRADLKQYMLQDNHSVVQSIIVTTGHSLSILSAPGCGMEAVSDSVFEILGVPAIHALVTNYSYEQWKESIRGMDSMYLGNVYTGEYDGQLITVPFACMEEVQTEVGIDIVWKPIKERVDKIVRLAKNWALLSKIPMAEKKVAIILHNMPPRADMIGCAYGLDTPESVFNIVEILKENGATLDYDFASGKEIIDKITESVTNDGRFSSNEELLNKASSIAYPHEWDDWFKELDNKVQEELRRDWGDAPGEFMAIDDKILVPCIINGNVLIGLQPPRALEEKAEECYHSTDIVCPYQYIAFYRYVEKVFGANVIIHVGTHGTIEWLPGKEIGLSNTCYPDIAIGDLPNIYPYIIDVPGEGAQAKRRTAAAVIDHLIPSMKEAGVYGELETIDELISQYYHAKQNENGKIDTLIDEIWKTACDNYLDKDLAITKEQMKDNPENVMEKLHLWVSEIKCSEIKDGLHIFGKVPQNERLRNMVRLLVRVANGEIPSIRESLAILYNKDIDELIDHPNICDENGITNAMFIEKLDDLGRDLFEALDGINYNATQVPSIIDDFLKSHEQEAISGSTQALTRCLTFACSEVYTRLCQTTDELTNLLAAVEGKFVPKGPSGAPSRGNALILPTGRNFYTVDPTQIPSRASWQTGVRLGKQLIAQYEEENGELPENIAIVVYAGETMKTNGDDIAEVLYLYGMKPIWLGSTDKVIGLEVIPIEELGRPRIDVTLRISGLFRDTFPNLIDLIDDAVNIVATLEETHEQNFIKKNIDRDLKELLKNGMSQVEAYEKATLRVFGCPPGTYGAGVSIMINSKKWSDVNDLGNAYMTWSSHGYSKKYHGDKLQDIFSMRLKNCNATVKNISSSEADMLDSDDFYNYHGGLISAVKLCSGETPSSYSTNAADVNHVVTKNIHQETARIMRARINNPEWINGLKQHGFKGAQEFSAMVDIIFGWDATSNVIDDYMYDSVYETYMNDKELRDWIKEENPWALHAMSERLLEAVQRNMWNASDDKVENLQQIYLDMEGNLEE